MTRYEANKKILEIIENYCEDFPEQRFYQVLQNIGIVYPNMPDTWYEESTDTLIDLQKNFK